MSRIETPPPTEPKLLYTAKEAAAILGMTVTGVMTLYRQGLLPAKRLGGTEANPRNIRFTRNTLDNFALSLPDYSPPSANHAVHQSA